MTGDNFEGLYLQQQTSNNWDTETRLTNNNNNNYIWDD